MSAAPSLDARIDELYQLPLEEFTAARNALAKELSGSARERVKTLVKPSLPTWAVNQLRWQDEASYRALIDASEKLRAAHRAALSGKNADTRAADRLHQSAVERAVARTLAILKRKGIPLSDAAMQSMRTTLSSLPTEEPEGRLTREPPAAGFSLLTGITPGDIPQGRVKHASPKASDDARKKPAIDKELLAAIKRAEKERLKKEKEEERRAKEQRARELKAETERAQEEFRRAQQALQEAKRKLKNLK